MKISAVRPRYHEKSTRKFHQKKRHGITPELKFYTTNRKLVQIISTHRLVHHGTRYRFLYRWWTPLPKADAPEDTRTSRESRPYAEASLVSYCRNQWSVRPSAPAVERNLFLRTVEIAEWVWFSHPAKVEKGSNERNKNGGQVCSGTRGKLYYRWSCTFLA